MAFCERRPRSAFMDAPDAGAGEREDAPSPAYHNSRGSRRRAPGRWRSAFSAIRRAPAGLACRKRGRRGMSLFDLTGKVAVVTGSSRGIGRAIAGRLAEHGARVVISSRKAEACEAVVRDLEAQFWGRLRAGDSRQYLLEGRSAPSRRRRERAFRRDRHSRLQCGVQSLLRSPRRHFRRSVPQNPRQQHHRQSLADLASSRPG